MKRKMCLFTLLTLVISSINGQQLSVGGYVFEQKDREYVARIPFATVYYYNYQDTARVEFVAFTNMLGEYTLNNMRNGRYIVKVIANGYQLKRQKVEFRDVVFLAKNNRDNSVNVHISMEKSNENEHIVNSTIYNMAEYISSGEETLEYVIQHLQNQLEKGGNSSGKRSYRVWIGGIDMELKLYNELKNASLKKIARDMGDRLLKKSYIIYYDISESNALVDGVFNVVFNDKTRKPTERGFIPIETTDFLIIE